jgi:hypothetical protein
MSLYNYLSQEQCSELAKEMFWLRMKKANPVIKIIMCQKVCVVKICNFS